jgi:hypothetical protein
LIDTILNLMFKCSHRRLTRPLSPVSKGGQAHEATYVVCLDCGKQFAYDVQKMRIGKAIDGKHEHAVLPPDMPDARRKKVKYALWASVPLALFAGAVLRGGKRKGGKPGEGAPPES